MKKPILTIGMPVFNEQNYIAKAIESLLAQTYKDFILIISDNASTDRTPKISNYYAAQDNRIIYIRHSKNRGAFFNFKCVLEKAKTPFFMWASGHDMWHPQFIEKLLPLLQKENLVLVYPQSREIKIDGTEGEIYEDDYTTVNIDKPAERYLHFLKRVAKCNIIHGIWRTDVLKNCWLKPIISYDVLLLLDASFKGKFKQQKEILFFRRIVCQGEDKYHRQYAMITGKYTQKQPPPFFLKGEFIFENVKLIFNQNFLNIFSKFSLSIRTICFWIKQWHIKPILVKTLKAILPNKIYFLIKNKVKKK